jgi:hypothetical protein
VELESLHLALFVVAAQVTNPIVMHYDADKQNLASNIPHFIYFNDIFILLEGETGLGIRYIVDICRNCHNL